VQVKGRTRSTRIYTLCEALHADPVALKALSEKHHEFLRAYRGQQWDEAEHLLGECRSSGVASLEACYQAFQTRIPLLRNTVLPPNWDGSFIMSEK
jgi:adenylate cyclase